MNKSEEIWTAVQKDIKEPNVVPILHEGKDHNQLKD